MAYDDSRFGGEPGFRVEPDFRSGGGFSDSATLSGGGLYSTGSYPAAGTGESTESTLGLAGRGPSKSLEDVFDDPDHGEPGRDRLGVHVAWEISLLLALAGVGYLLRHSHPEAVRGDQLRTLMLSIAVLGLLALGMGLSLRAGAVNLAIGPIALGSAIFFASHADRGTLTAAVVTGLLALGVGAAVALVTVGFHVPGWAASLAAGLAVAVWIERHTEEVKLTGGSQQGHNAVYWLGAVAALALLGGLLGAIRPIRRAVGRFRPVADPARRRGAAAGVIAALAILGSAGFAATAGVLQALRDTTVHPTDNPFALTGLALGAALLGGTSAFGRRGGFIGTILAAGLIVTGMRFLTVNDRSVSTLAAAAAAITVGLIVTRMVEVLGRPSVTAETAEEWEDSGSTSTSDTEWSPRQPSWTTSESPLSRWSSDDR